MKIEIFSLTFVFLIKFYDFKHHRATKIECGSSMKTISGLKCWLRAFDRRSPVGNIQFYLNRKVDKLCFSFQRFHKISKHTNFEQHTNVENIEFCRSLNAANSISFLESSLVLASAHSFFSPLSSVTVILGAHYITKIEPSQQRFTIDLSQIIRHPDFLNDEFNHNRNPNDIAILILPQAAVINEFVQVAVLPTGAQVEELFIGELATVSGFGRPNPGEGWTDDLRSTSNHIISNEECQRLLTIFTIHDSDMCAENTGRGSSCGGDCGSPVTILRNGVRIQIGIVPMGPPCNEGWPDLFTRINSFLSWILENAV
ncbi:hypothetical protein PVAND_016467 [Polypedilum vanderplanki]|uniref:Peptidase S1 domain-containing protein n=1 Tax=Polypedilum vanderplanki TaxID=319348 RepID=A0A9J6BFW5_POLVA|nr:hypothetical protein PVAND_016467 [Polypedilum vanderplanki]